MACSAMTMSTGNRIAEHLSIGVLTRTYPRERIQNFLVKLGLESKRVRDLPVEEVISDGSYLSRIYFTQRDMRKKRNGIIVRVIEHELEGVEGAEPIYRLITTLLDAEGYPAQELAGLYPERREVEVALDEFKTHIRGWTSSFAV